MRITSTTCRFLAAAVVGLGLMAATVPQTVAQTETQPVQNRTQFGPRVNKQPQPDQAAAAQQPSVEVIATHGAWKIQCETAQKDGQRQCGMVQTVQNEKNPKAFLNLVVLRVKQGDQMNTTMRMIVPIGVYLPLGVALEIDDNAIGRVGFVRCMGQICMANGDVKPETLDKLKKGGAANFIIYEAPGMGLPMKISLEGFSAALAELDKL